MDKPIIPDYEVIKPIGKGGYGVVWLAKSFTGSYRAIKVINADSHDPQITFSREISGITNYEPISRHHHGLVDILHAGMVKTGIGYYYVMELADDFNATSREFDPATYVPDTLANRIQRHGRLTVSQSVDISSAILNSINYLHKNGLLHRDVKAANILFVNGEAKLGDPGLVANCDSADSFVGSEGYIPPDGPGTVRADLYAVGKLLYQMLTGNNHRLFPSIPSDLMCGKNHNHFIKLNRIILQACNPEPRKAFKDAQEFLDALAIAGHKEFAPLNKRLLISASLLLLSFILWILFHHYYFDKSNNDQHSSPINTLEYESESAVIDNEHIFTMPNGSKIWVVESANHYFED